VNYLDTSAFVRAWRLKKTPAGITRAHTAAEFYATLTGGITIANAKGEMERLKFAPREVAEAAQATFAAVTFVDFTGMETLKALTEAAGINVQSANIHDLMHAAVAEREKCKAIVTSNTRHFSTVTKLPLLHPTTVL
jgi:predicted nucleic acid-binding protein